MYATTGRPLMESKAIQETRPRQVVGDRCRLSGVSEINVEEPAMITATTTGSARRSRTLQKRLARRQPQDHYRNADVDHCAHRRQDKRIFIDRVWSSPEKPLLPARVVIKRRRPGRDTGRHAITAVGRGRHGHTANRRTIRASEAQARFEPSLVFKIERTEPSVQIGRPVAPPKPSDGLMTTLAGRPCAGQ